MPELPEVETIVRGLKRSVTCLPVGTVGKKIIGVKINLPKVINTTPLEFRRLTRNARITSARRRAKIIIIDLSNGYTLVIHLKISGQLVYTKKSLPIKRHTHIIFDLDNGAQLRFRDIRRFGYVRVFPAGKVPEVLAGASPWCFFTPPFLLRSGCRGVERAGLAEFGPEPLEKSFTLKLFKEMLTSRPGSRIKPLLMDQHFIAGIGNLYADEILFSARVHPLRRAETLTLKEAARIFSAIKRILTRAIRYKGTSVDLYVNLEGKPGAYLKYLKAYDREGEPCLVCRTPLKRIKIGSRSAYFCPSCQK